VKTVSIQEPTSRRAGQAALRSHEGSPGPAPALGLQEVRTLLKAADLRPTRQRIALGRILFADRHRHVAAEELHRDVVLAGGALSLATVYNTLRHFCEVGLIRQVATHAGRAQYDTSTSDHQHFYVEEEDRLIDIPAGAVRFGRLPEPPEGYVVTAIDVLIRLRRVSARPERPEPSGSVLCGMPPGNPPLITGDAP